MLEDMYNYLKGVLSKFSFIQFVHIYFFSVSGRLHLCHVTDSKLETVCPLMGGHAATVRCLQWDHKVSVCPKEYPPPHTHTHTDTHTHTSSSRF